MSATTHHLHPLRQARIKRGLSQQDIGDKLDPPIGKGAVSQWESAHTYPTREYALQLVALFPGELTLDNLYRFEPKGEAA